MIELPLTLRLAPAMLRSATAWFLPASDPADWLPLLARDFPEADPAIYILPTSRGDRRPAGIFVVPPPVAAGKMPPHPAPPWLPFGRLHNLYIPTDAQLWPPVTEHELSSRLPFEINLLHPALGLIGFTPQDRITIAQLLAPPPRQNSNWTLARPGNPPPARLTSIIPVEFPDARDILEDAREDIGIEPLDSAPPRPNEPKGNHLLKGAITSPFAVLSNLLQRLAEKLRRKPGPGQPPAEKTPNQNDAPGTGARTPARPAPTGPGIGERLSNLLSKGAQALRNLTPRQFSALAAALEERRNREINRLLSLLQSDPDEGLKYALPLAGDPGRGLAPPSSSLGARDIRFSTGGGSGPADPWRLSEEIQQRLRENYRRLASRELQLGRHRRAAYIFAQLLGDWSSAANALKQGRHFREAATLYRERLNNRLAAAECLAEGGLLSEAIPLFEELSLFERAGDLYTRLEQTEKAHAAYRKAVQQMVLAGDQLKAAAFLENRLAAPREALAVLDSAWPARPNAAACMQEAFRLLARLDDTDEAHARVKRFRDYRGSHYVRHFAAVLADVATTFPNAQTQHLAADATRVLVGRNLEGASIGEASELLRHLPALAPADALLPRDTQRFTQRIPVPPQPMSAIRPALRRPHTMKAFHIVREFRLPPDIQWRAFTSHAHAFFGVGTRDEHWFAIRCDFRGDYQRLDLGAVYSKTVGQLLSLLYCPKPASLGIMRLGARPIDHAVAFPATEKSPTVAISMPWLPQLPLAAACDEFNNVWVLHNEAVTYLDLVLSVFDPAGEKLIATQVIGSDLIPKAPPRGIFHLAVRPNHLYVALDATLLIQAYGRPWHIDPLPRHATHLAASHPQTRNRVAVGMDEGAMIFTDGLDSRPAAEGLLSPRLAFTRGGTLFAAAKSECRAYRFDGKQPQCHTLFPGLAHDAATEGFAILPTPELNELALVAPTGTVQIIRLDSA